MTKPDPATLKTACDALTSRDRAFEKAFKVTGVPVWRYSGPDYRAIARMIAFQQITTKAAASIWARVEDALGAITPASLLAAEEETLRTCGLSRPKIRHLRSIAEAIEAGTLDLDRVSTADMDEARSELIAVKGIGPWTADLFLLNCGRLDAFPVADVGLMESYRLLSGLDQRHDAKAFSVLAESWRPWRGVAAHLLWGWINAERARTRPASGGGKR